MKYLILIIAGALVLVGCVPKEQGKVLDFAVVSQEYVDNKVETLEAQNQRIMDYLGVVEYQECVEWTGTWDTVRPDGTVKNKTCSEIKIVLTKDKNKVEWVKLHCDMGEKEWCDSKQCSSREIINRCQELKELINL